MEYFFLKNKIRSLLVESSVTYFLRDFFDVLCGNYQLLIILEKKKIPIKKKQVVSNCFIKPLISSAFTTVASRLNSEQKEKDK